MLFFKALWYTLKTDMDTENSFTKLKFQTCSSVFIHIVTCFEKDVTGTLGKEEVHCWQSN